MNEKDCIATTSEELGGSLRKMLKNPNKYYYEEEENPKIDETKVCYPPSCKDNYSSEMQGKLEDLKKSHKKLLKNTIQKDWKSLIHKNPGILSKNVAFRTDNGNFLSNLIQISMEMQNMEEEELLEKKEEKEDDDDKQFMIKLYNGDIDFDEKKKEKSEDFNEMDFDEDNESEDMTDDDEDETDVQELLQEFETTGKELMDQYDRSIKTRQQEQHDDNKKKG